MIIRFFSPKFSNESRYATAIISHFHTFNWFSIPSQRHFAWNCLRNLTIGHGIRRALTTITTGMLWNIKKPPQFLRQWNVLYKDFFWNGNFFFKKSRFAREKTSTMALESVRSTKKSSKLEVVRCLLLKLWMKLSLVDDSSTVWTKGFFSLEWKFSKFDLIRHWFEFQRFDLGQSPFQHMITCSSELNQLKGNKLLLQTRSLFRSMAAATITYLPRGTVCTKLKMSIACSTLGKISFVHFRRN